MQHEFFSPLVSLAIERVAHVQGGSEALIKFRDGSVYRCEPFRDDDWFELLRHHQGPGNYFNAIIARREGLSMIKLERWPLNLGSHAQCVYFMAPPEKS